MHFLVLHLSPQDLFASLVPRPPHPAFMYTVDLNSFSFFLGIEWLSVGTVQYYRRPLQPIVKDLLCT